MKQITRLISSSRKAVFGCSSCKTRVVCHGESALNFVCHCSVCRKSASVKHLASCGFKEEQIEWEGDFKTETPENSSNPRFYCGCNKKTYLGEDASRVLGLYAFPLDRHEGQAPDRLQPNLHIFYGSRETDVNDSLVKWETLPQGKVIQPSGADDPNVLEGIDASSGRYKKESLPHSPVRPGHSKMYHFTETDPIANHDTYIPAEKIQERVKRKYQPSPGIFHGASKEKKDVIIIGGGHNGLTAASYLARQGLNVCVLERRNVTGGNHVHVSEIEVKRQTQGRLSIVKFDQLRFQFSSEEYFEAVQYFMGSGIFLNFIFDEESDIFSDFSTKIIDENKEPSTPLPKTFFGVYCLQWSRICSATVTVPFE